MKKLLYCAAALAVAFFAGSCQQEKLEPVQESNAVTFTVEAPAALQTRAIADGQNVDQLVYEVWLTPTIGKLDGGQKLYQAETKMVSDGTVNKATLTLDLVNDQKFAVLFWAQVDAADAYNTNELTAVTYAKNEYNANDESLAAFYAVAYVNDCQHVDAAGSAVSSEVVLRRPFAQLNIGTLNTATDYTVSLVNSEVTVSKVNNIFNVATSKASSDAPMTFHLAAVPNDPSTLKVNGVSYQYAGMNYMFAGDNVTVDYKIETKIIADNGSAMTGNVTNTVSSVPLKENYRTNIVGNLLTSKVDYEIVVDADFNEPDDYSSYVTTTAELDEALKANKEVINVALGSDVSLTANDAYLKLGGADTKEIIIDGNKIDTKSGSEDYYTLNLSTTYWSRLNTVNPDAKIILRNLNLTSSQESGTWNSYDVTFQCNVEMENVNALKAIALDGVEKTAVLKNVTISESHDYYALWIAAAGQTVTLEDVTINSEGRGIKIDDQYVGENTKLVTLNVDGLKVKSNNKAAIMVKTPKGAHITLKDVDITEVKADTSNEVWIDEDASSYINMVTVTGGSMIVEGQETVTINSMETLKSELEAAGEAGAGYTVLEISSDIDMTGQEWTPIGNSTNKFQGTFDGNNKTISNLVITGNKSDVGLFGMTTNGEIKNLTVNNAKVSGYLDVAVVAGTPYTSKYTNIKVTGHVEVNGFAYVGAVGGKNAYANWTDVTVDVDETSYVNANSVANGTAYRTYVGGVCGFNGEGGHSFQNISSNIDVTGSTIDVGGLFGIAHYGNNFVNCSCSGDVEITAAAEAADAEEIGGIAGVWNNGGADVTFDGCSFTGTLKTNITEGVDLSDNTIVGKAYSASGTGKLIIK